MTTCIEYRLGKEEGAAHPRKGRPLPCSEPRLQNVLIYRNDLIERSETFVVAQATAMKRYRGIFCGLARSTDGILPDCSESAVLTSGNRIKQYMRKRAYAKTGRALAWEQQCREFNPVLMHAHFAIDGAFALPLRKTLGLPLVVSLHGYDVTSSDKSLRARHGGRLYLERREELFASADLFVCISRFIREQALERGYPRDKLWVHATGIDLDIFRPAEAQDREPLVLFVGRLVEKKGCAHLIRAMRTVQTRLLTAQLVVVGEGPLRKELEKLAEDVLPGRYMFLGAQPRHVVHAWLRRAVVFSVPSIVAANGDAEGLGMVFCEAQAMGVPVVSFASGGTPEAVESGASGYLLPEGDEKGLAQKITALLQNSLLWQEMSVEGKRRMAERFDLRVQTRILEAKYDEVIARYAQVSSERSILQA